jgi:hypothetical protein
MKFRHGTLISLFAYLAGYCALVAWFKWVDVYHAHFATAGPLVFAYNAFRVLFIFYLFWIVHAAGALLLRAGTRNVRDSLNWPDRLALSFFAGAGVWHVALLALGYLNLYTVPVAVAITFPFVAFSFPDVRAAFGQLHQTIAAWRRFDRLTLAGAILIFLFAATLLMVKGLYPGGGHDYFTHYFYFYQTVIDSGGIWPNDVWYHYYYSKGAGLYFLAMLLTDPLAPQLVTSCFMAPAALVIFLFGRRFAPEGAWPWVGVAIFLLVYIYTPIWGHFEKLHELNTCFIIALLWSAANTIERSSTPAWPIWAIATASTIIATVIVNITAAVFLGAVFALLTFWNLIRAQHRASIICLGFAGVTATVLVPILAINFFTTGLPLDQGILLLWPFADVEQLDRWGVLPEVLMLHWGTMGLVNESVPLSLKFVKLLVQSSRLDLLFPLFIGGLIVTIVAIWGRTQTETRGTITARSYAAMLAAASFTFITVALLMGRAQPVSFFRYTSFMVPITILTSIALWTIPIPASRASFLRTVRDRRMPVAVFAVTVVAILTAASQRARLFDTVLPRALLFATGGYSLDTAYTLQTGWPDKPWGAIYPGARSAFAIVGPHTPIWSMHVTSYCMLPDCRIEGFMSFKIGAGWDRLMFATPEQGQEVLHAAGIDYFLFSRELPVQDYLPLSPLFRPGNIARYLGIRWTDGVTSLLTWTGPDTTPLDENWLAEYQRALQQSPELQGFPYADMQAIFARLNATPHPWHPFKLPWESR